MDMVAPVIKQSKRDKIMPGTPHPEPPEFLILQELMQSHVKYTSQQGQAAQTEEQSA